MVEIAETYLRYVAVVALFVSSGILILNVARDVLELENQPRIIAPPVGPPQTVWEWRFMSTFAQEARFLMDATSEVLHGLIKIVIVIILCFYLAQGAIDLVLYFLGGQANFEVVLNNSTVMNLQLTDSYLTTILKKVMAVVVGTFGPLLVWQLSRLIYLVVQARRHPRMNKI